jgi:large repetitive protein
MDKYLFLTHNIYINIYILYMLPSISLSSSANPSNYGESVTFTTIISPNPPGSGPTPTGSVEFLERNLRSKTESALGNVSLNLNQPLNGESEAIITITNIDFIPIGSFGIIASYSGDSNYSANSTGIIQTVNHVTTTTTLTSSENPSLVGQSVTYIATVTPANPGPRTLTGTVTFTDNGETIGTVSIFGKEPTNSGQVSTSTTYTSVGTHTIIVTYSGDSNFAASSASLTQTVNN